MGLDRVALAVESEDPTLPARRLAQRKEEADSGRLACTVGSEVADHLALGHLEVEMIEGDRVAVTLGQSFGVDRRICHCQPLSAPEFERLPV